MRSSSSSSRHELGNIPYFFFLSFTTLITFLLLVNHQQFFLAFLQNSSSSSSVSSSPVSRAFAKSSTIDNRPLKMEESLEKSTLQIPLTPQTMTTKREETSSIIESSTSSASSPSASTAPVSIAQISNPCPSSVSQLYNSINESKLIEMKENKKWCNSMIAAHKVQIGRSWGSLSKQQQMMWDTKKCNELLNVGTLLSCEERYGWKYFENWLKNKKMIFSNASNVDCVQDFKTSGFCKVSSLVFSLFFSVNSFGNAGRWFRLFFSFRLTAVLDAKCCFELS
jgi:hypothetical protein